MTLKRKATVNRISVTTTQRRLRVPAARIRELVAFIARAEKRGIEHIEVAVVGRTRMASLNRAHLGHRGSTDVLSFDLSGGGGPLVAQIVVCSDAAQREGRRRGHGAQKELLLYVTHGLLHLMGYDDHTTADARRMHAREDELLEAFGVGPVYER